jgi:protein-tyrosine-phosphatase/glycerol uptake facilitator-like aquaporin
MGERLSNGNVAIALLANTLATGAALLALISTFGSISGAHFNPAVTLADASLGGLPWREVPAYIAGQIIGAFAGVAIAHLMFGLPIFFASRHARAGVAQIFSEFVATFGLLAVIWGCVRFRAQAVPFAVAAYIMAAYWFTASTSFANPAVTLARSVSDTFRRHSSNRCAAFIVAQLAEPWPRRFFSAGSRHHYQTRPKLCCFHTIMKTAMNKKRVLILCTGNSARSQMAEGLLRADAGERFEVASAGVNPSHVRPEAIEVMREVGIDISGHRSKSVDEFVAQEFDYVITVCDNANEQCPIFPGRLNASIGALTIRRRCKVTLNASRSISQR